MTGIHTYSICAYGESPFLEDCIKSVLDQDYDSRVIICTSTPNEGILKLADKYEVKVFANNAVEGIASDWNYALECATTPLVTIAHQDDVYDQRYSSRMVELYDKQNEKPLILFSDYGELRDEGIVNDNTNLRIKRLLMGSLKKRRVAVSRFEKRNILRFGSAISCPAVTYNINKIETPLFEGNFKCDLDWETWERLSNEDGSFCFCPEILMHHRIHKESETTRSIENNIRASEDFQMLRKFWPFPIAALINKFYSFSQTSNS